MQGVSEIEIGTELTRLVQARLDSVRSRLVCVMRPRGRVFVFFLLVPGHLFHCWLLVPVRQVVGQNAWFFCVGELVEFVRTGEFKLTTAANVDSNSTTCMFSNEHMF